MVEAKTKTLIELATLDDTELALTPLCRKEIAEKARDWALWAAHDALFDQGFKEAAGWLALQINAVEGDC